MIYLPTRGSPSQIARGLVLPLTISVSCVHIRKTPPARVIVAAVVVTFGFVLGVVPSKNLPAKSVPSTLSLIYGVLSSLFIAVHAVLIKSSLPYCNDSTIQLAWWTNAGSAIMLFPFVIFNGELLELWSKFSGNTNDNFSAPIFLWGSLITGSFGFLLCIASLLSIKVTSPITHMFSSVRALSTLMLYFLGDSRVWLDSCLQAARSVIQTLVGVWIFKDILTV